MKLNAQVKLAIIFLVINFIQKKLFFFVVIWTFIKVMLQKKSNMNDNMNLFIIIFES